MRQRSVWTCSARCKQDLQAIAGTTEQVSTRDAAIVERERRRARRPQSHLIFFAHDFQPGFLFPQRGGDRLASSSISLHFPNAGRGRHDAVRKKVLVPLTAISSPAGRNCVLIPVASEPAVGSVMVSVAILPLRDRAAAFASDPPFQVDQGFIAWNWSPRSPVEAHAFAISRTHARYAA